MAMILFQDRRDAANKLVAELQKYKNRPDTILLAIPRGGLELGNLMAKELHLPLDIILSKKIGYPNNPEFAIGAVSLDHKIVEKRFLDSGEVSPEYIEQETKRLQKLLQERDLKYREGRTAPDLKNKTVIIVDDGVATGQTLLLTLMLLREKGVKKIIIAVPVAPPHAAKLLRDSADEMICLAIPENFYAISQFYSRFDQVDEEDAIRLFREICK